MSDTGYEDLAQNIAAAYITYRMGYRDIDNVRRQFCSGPPSEFWLYIARETDRMAVDFRARLDAVWREQHPYSPPPLPAPPPERVQRRRAVSRRVAAARREQKRGGATQDEIAALAAETTDCFYCGVALAAVSVAVDHRVPLSRGGTHALDNLRVICARCNRLKGTRTEVEHLAARALVAEAT
jgi:5-methylcytosine-specific restriction endonuclease McrA